MEGLLPLMYRAIKRNTTRRNYERLSEGAAQTYNIADFYDHIHKPHAPPSTAEEIRKREGHRRHKSMVEYGVNNVGYCFNDENEVKNRGSFRKGPPAKKLVRFGSHRMFSCITGAS